MSKTAPHSPEYQQGGKVLSAVDWLGNRFRVGEQVLYCIAVGRGQLMALGIVTQIQAHSLTNAGWEDCDPDNPEAVYREWFRSYSRRVDRPYQQIKVQVLTQKTSGRWDHEERQKPVWVNAVNITALPQVKTT